MPAILMSNLKKAAGRMACGSALYHWSLAGPAPAALLVRPADPWPGDAERGRWLCDGAFDIEGQQLEMRGNFWEPKDAGSIWLSHLHSFEWMRDLRALGGDDARRQARGMIQHWIERYNRWDEGTWNPATLGRRIAVWIALYDFHGASADDDYQSLFFDSLMRQARHLSRTLSGRTHGLEMLQALRGLAFAGLALEGRGQWLDQALSILDEEIDLQILSDGGHVSRSPATLLEALRALIDLRCGLLAAEYPVPAKLQHAIDRAGPALRFFRCADKGFALFNGAQEGDICQTDAVLAQANARGKPLRGLPHTGYERLSQGRTVLVADTGAPPAWPHDGQAHAAPLAFELTYGRERIFVNCGTHPTDADWRDALRGTGAHNVLTIDCRNACEIRADGHFGRRAQKVVCERQETGGAVLLDMSHDGYLTLNGITHRRRLYLGDQGEDLRGEDTLSCSVGLNRPLDVAVRFHLHPRAQVSLIQDGTEALLRIPGGTGWRFCHSGGILSLDNSVYMGDGARPRKTKQLVISGSMENDNLQVKWALRRENL